MKSVFYLVLSALCLFTACSDDDDDKGNSSVTGITLSQPTLTLEVGGSNILTATLEPGGASATIQWESSNLAVATVTSGAVIAVGEGTAVITARVGNVIDNCVVTVVDKITPPTSVTLNKNTTTLAIGASETLTATLLPAGAIGDIVWTSSAPTVASVTNGVVVGASEGTAVITATCNSLTASCTVTVSSTGGTPGGDDDGLNGSNYYVLFLDDNTYKKISSKVVADLRPDEATAVVDIWPAGDSYSAVEPSGPNAFNQMEGWIALRANQNPWNGVGAGGVRVMKSFDMTAIDGTYTFHCAMKSRDGGKNELCLFSEDGTETWTVVPAWTDNEWHHYEIPMDQFISGGWTFPRPYTLAGDGRYTFAFRSTGAGTVIQIDGVFIYKK